MVEVRPFGQVEKRARRAQGVGEGHDDAAVHDVTGRAPLGRPGHRAGDALGAGLDELDPARAGERHQIEQCGRARDGLSVHRPEP
jgi:hypothetical protein